MTLRDDATLRHCIDEFLRTNDASILRAYMSRYESSTCKSPVALLAAILLARICNSLIHVCEHAEMLDHSARSDQDYLAKCCLPEEISQYGVPAIVKTVSLSIHGPSGHLSIIVTELGDEHLDKDALRRISEVTGISHSALLKHSTVNSGQFNPIDHLGLEPGYVGPFPHFIEQVDYFVFRQLTKPSYVAVRFTPQDILLIDRRILQPLARSYLEKLGKQYIVI